MRERSVLVDQQLGLLSRHTDVLRAVTDVLKKDGSLHDDHPMNEMWEPIGAFQKAVDEAADRLERLTADEAFNHVDVTIGFFQKRLRRAAAAQDALKKLSEKIMFDAAYVDAILVHPHDDDPEVNKTLEKLFLTGDLTRLGLQAMERSLRLQVPTIIAIHEAVFAALVSSIARGIAQLRIDAESTKNAA
jgi:hypothetical protein